MQQSFEFSHNNLKYEIIFYNQSEMAIWTPRSNGSVGDLGFSFSWNGGVINWGEYPEHTALLPEEVIARATELAKVCAEYA